MEAKRKLAIIIPTYNETESIEKTLQNILPLKLATWIIVVDDSSTDGTEDVVKRQIKSSPEVILLSRLPPRSFSASYIDGFQKAISLGADFIIQMDGDGSHPPETIPKILEALNTHNLVIGSRYMDGGGIKNWTWRRKMISFIGNQWCKAMLGSFTKDWTGGYNGWKTDLLKKVIATPCDYDGYVFQIWLKWRAYHLKASIIEIPFIFTDREKGHSKFGFSIMREGIRGVSRLRAANRLH